MTGNTKNVVAIIAVLALVLFFLPGIASARAVPQTAAADRSTILPLRTPHLLPQNLCAQPVGGQEGCAAAAASSAYQVGNLTYHNGKVLHSPSSYLIFWLPPGFNFDSTTLEPTYPQASSSAYEALVQQYFRDIGNTAFYSLLQQYTDSSGAPGISTSLGGSWIDISPYPNGEGSKSNPLQDGDIISEVAHAIDVNGWPTGDMSSSYSVFYVFTGYNAFSCADGSCSFKDYCAYHSAFSLNGQTVIYGTVPDPGNTNTGTCLVTGTGQKTTPNSGVFADSAVNLVSHEQFESMTDPVFDGWFYLDTGHEIGDECAWKMGTVGADGSNVVLNGHKYILQQEWSNHQGGCYLPTLTSGPIKVTASYSVQGGGSGYEPPTFTYVSNGVVFDAVLSTSAQSFTADSGSTWGVSATLGGSGSSERWQTGQSTSGTSSAGLSLSFAYFHQYADKFPFNIVGGGAGYLPPTVLAFRFGLPFSISGSNLYGSWVDAQSNYTYPEQLPGSTTSERWISTATGGIVSALGPIGVTYYHQYLLPAAYALKGTGSPAAPSLAYTYLGRLVNVSLSVQTKPVWVDVQSSYSVTDPLGGSGSSDRWSASGASGQITSAAGIDPTYYHQYLLTTVNGTTGSTWYNESATASVVTLGTYQRSQGSGLRVTGYTLDGGAAHAVQGASGNVSVSVQMDRPHTLAFTTTRQYQVSLDSGATAALKSVTPPTLSGDAYWYDQGSTVNLALNGVWGRTTSGTGSRLGSYAVNGAAGQAVLTADPVSVFGGAGIVITSPQIVTANLVTQYLFTSGSGSVASVTGPTIQGDPGWYDSGTMVTLSYNYAWNASQGARLDAVSVVINGAKAGLQRSGVGTFTESFSMDRPAAVQVVPVVQYKLTVVGAAGVTTSPPSPTKDAFFDAGSVASVSAPLTWDATKVERLRLLSYALDGVTTTPVASGSQGDNVSLQVTFDKPHQLALNSAVEYLVTFRVTDGSGDGTISPSSLRIDVQGQGAVDVQDSRVWLDNGSVFGIRNLTWEGVDVAPPNQTVGVDSPKNVTVASRVYDATLKVSDYLSLPIAGASAHIVLANDTAIDRATGSDGTIRVGHIPLGRFNATVSYLGTQTSVLADASHGGQISATVFISAADIGVVAAVIICVAVLAVVGTRKLKRVP